MYYLYFIIYCNIRNINLIPYVVSIIFYSLLLINLNSATMKATISNLNGEQQNALNHLSKNFRRALRPLMVICYGHRSSTTFKTSAFLNSGMEKKNSSIFDIMIIVSDDEVLPDGALMEIAKRNSPGNPTDGLIILRMADVLLNLTNRSRFFSAIFRRGIVLYANKDALKMLPSPLPPVSVIGRYEKQRLATFLHYAEECLDNVERDLSACSNDPFLMMLSLNASAIYAGRYFIGAYCGIELQGEFKKIINFSANINTALTDIFPRNTKEEQLLFHVINLTFIDEGFSPGIAMIKVLCKRVARLIAVSKSYSQKKIAELQPA